MYVYNMPRYTRRRHRRKLGGSLKSFWDKTKGFLKRTKILSKVGNVLTPMIPGKYRGLANMGLQYAKQQGYGRRRRGGALRPAGARRLMSRRRGGSCCGGALNPVGGMRLLGRRVRRLRMRPRLPAKY